MVRRKARSTARGGRRTVRWKVTATSIPRLVSSGDGGSWVSELVDEIVDADDTVDDVSNADGTGEIVELAG